MLGKIIFTFIAATLLWSCSKDAAVKDPMIEVTDPVGPVDPVNPEMDVWAVNRTDQFALNIVFFKPKDFTADATLIHNVSEVMLYIQNWYELQMDLQGFGKKTFGLVTNQNGKVRVHLVEGKLPGSSYSGHNAIVGEIDAYFAANPGFKAGKHTFVLGHRNSGVPFYGIKHMAFANSEDFELKSTGKSLAGFQLKVCPLLGGIMHELGHGLNLPHCAHKGSDVPKVSLMSFGNHTYQDISTIERVFLTASSTAILDVCEPFNKKSNMEYYTQDGDARLLQYSVTKDETKNALVAQGEIDSDVDITNIYIGHDGFPAGGGDNYDDITFKMSIEPNLTNESYKFYGEMPYSDLFNDYKDENKSDIQLTINAIDENGNRTKVGGYVYTMDLAIQKPNDDVNKIYVPFTFTERSNWTVSANTTSPNAMREAATVIDGDLSTYWHSSYPYNISGSGPHQIDIDMKESRTFRGIYLYSDREGTNYRPKHITVQTSLDGLVYTHVKDIYIASVSDAVEVKIIFDTDITSQYIRVQVDEVFISLGAEENLIFNEIDIIQE
ncbi:discoidin domain-containing protein [Spongiimicrobium sp. 3-5]|uniref:discoidin domain-containing protein n=1 Tax=Spongiimicrobium sp. 3-5 TaxID=3332596 RepID=UPI00397FF134